MPGMRATVAKPTEEVEVKNDEPQVLHQKQLQTITFKLGSFDDDSRTFKAIGSTPQVDRQGDTIAQDGWVLDNFVKNPVVPWAHDYSQLPVARAIDIGVENGNLVFTYQAPPEGMYEFADTVWNMYRNQFLFAFSVGFMPLEYDGNWEDGYNFTKCELLEISAVPVPANAGALVLAQKMGFMSKKEAQSMIGKIEDALKGLKELNSDTANKRPKLEEKAAPKTEVKDEASKVEVAIVDKDSLKAMMTEILKELGQINEQIEEEETEAKGAIHNSLPLADKDLAWSKSKAIKQLKDYASDEDGNIDWGKYSKGFMFVDNDNDGDDNGGKSQGDYKLPFAYVIDGQPHAVWNAVKAIYGVLQGARGGVEGLSDDDLSGVLAEVKKYYKKFGEGEPGNTSDDGKGLTNSDNMVQNEDMTETKSGAKLSKDTKQKIKDVMDGLMQCAEILKTHHEALGELYNVGADSGESSADNDDPKGNGKPLEVEPDGESKSIESKDSKVDKTNEVVAEAKAAEDETSEEGAEQEGEEEAETSETDENADTTEETTKEATEDKSEEAGETEAEEQVEEEAKSEDEAAETTKTEEAEDKSDEDKDGEAENVETEKSAKSDDEYMIDPENLSDEDIVKLTAAVQAELDKENN